MRDPNDNLDRIYENYMAQPDGLRQTFENFNERTERTYQAFKEIMAEHPDMGKAAMVIMAGNQASHIIAVARDKGKNYAEVLSEIIVMISPMFQVMYDRLVSETIESEMAGSPSGEENS